MSALHTPDLNSTAAVTPGAAGQSTPHESAALHVRGAASYIDDVAESAGTLHAALGLSTHAAARLGAMDLTEVRGSDGVVAVLTAADIPGANQCGPIVHDDPILAEGKVSFVGQPIFVVVATTRDQARRAARKAKIDYIAETPQFDPWDAAAQNSLVVPPMLRRRGEPEQALANSPYRLQGRWAVGGQEQFYLEGQIAYARPQDGGCMHVLSSTQHPTEMQHMIAHALGLHSNQVAVEIRRMGGGFGGKESQSALFACCASVAAFLLQRPVKLRPDRDDDFMITGKRHDFQYGWDVGFDEQGRILGASLQMVARAGFSADLSGPVAARALCHVDNAYYLSDVDIRSLAARTNTQSNTAFRGFGGPQGALLIERIVDDIARHRGVDPLQIRKLNFYGGDSATEAEPRDMTPYGMRVEDNILQPLIAQLEASSGYAERRAEIAAFNAHSPVIRRGLALTPVKFGISFNVVHFNQAGALVHVYTDGTVLVNHGGTEMGQGLNTKVSQVVARTLGVPLAHVRSTATDTTKVANTSATAASTGSDLNGKAAEHAALQIRDRLAALACDPAQAGLATSSDQIEFVDGVVRGPKGQIGFVDLVQKAYRARVQLWSDGFYATPKLHWDPSAMTGRPFFYFAYGAAAAEVEVDTLTGEWRLLRADLLHDAGQSINPAIDIGQVEGAFIQGMGWLTTEELWWDQQGRLRTHAPSTYKIPSVSDCPADLRTALFDAPNREDTVFRSKAVGEPPLLLGFAAFFAIRDAVGSLSHDTEPVPLSAPATPEAILRACTALRQRSGVAGLPVKVSEVLA